MNVYSKSMTGAVNPLVASIERQATADRNIRANAAALAKVCLRIAEMTDAADFLGTHDGIAFCNAVFAMCGVDAVYNLRLDLEHEFGSATS